MNPNAPMQSADTSIHESRSELERELRPRSVAEDSADDEPTSVFFIVSIVPAVLVAVFGFIEMTDLFLRG